MEPRWLPKWTPDASRNVCGRRSATEAAKNAFCTARKSEKNIIFDSYKIFVPGLNNEIFNNDFGLTTSKFIDLKTEELRQMQFDKSLINIKENLDNNNLSQLIECYVNIANADDFIHENEVILINHAIEKWNLDFKVDKPKSGKKLKLKN